MYKEIEMLFYNAELQVWISSDQTVLVPGNLTSGRQIEYKKDGLVPYKVNTTLSEKTENSQDQEKIWEI